MEYIGLIIILFMLVLMVFFMMRSTKKQITFLSDFSQENGYNLKMNPEKFTVFEISSSINGSKWFLRGYARSTPSSDITDMNLSREYTEWQTTGSFPFGQGFVVSRDPSWKILSDEQILGYLKPYWMKSGFITENIFSYSVSDKAIMENYMIFCTDPKAFQLFLSLEIMESLKTWINNSGNSRSLLTLSITPSQIKIQANNLIRNADQAKEMIHLGTCIMKRRD